MKTIRIFISSPGDVQQERRIANKVITELNKQFAKYIHIEVLMWENFPLTADSTFQEGIDYFLKADVIDFAVFILWSRMGTPLCKKFRRADGSYYQSGTEYEFDMMMNLYKEKGWPRILTYVKDSEHTPSNLTNLKELEEYIKQKEQLRCFISEHFRDDESNSNYAYLQFGENASFEQRFKEHLKVLVMPFVGSVSGVKEWDGNPYVGLASYEYDQSAIFFGRRQLVYDTASAMVDFQHSEMKKSLIVLGESGSGKSSFIKAGLLPFLCDNNEDGDRSYRIIMPSAYGEKMRQGIVDILSEHYPFLQGHPFLHEICTSSPRGKNFDYLTFSIDKNQSNTLFLYIDQFEEVFTDSRISEEERLDIFAMLRGIVSTNRIHLIISIRNDFYYIFAHYEDLDWLKKHCVTVDMPAMGSAEILEVVEEPAKKACLKWEVSDKGEGLDHVIVNDALAIRDLPLIEFGLSELYNKRDGRDMLTFSAYKEIGGLEGAIAKYADNIYEGLSPEEKHVMNDILAYVIAKSSASDHTFVRKTALHKDIETSDLRCSTLDKLVNAHLFISGKDSLGNATVTITHEVLLRSWKAVAEWIKSEEQFLTTNTYYEESARYWIQNGKKQENLFREGAKLNEAEYYLFKYEKRMSSDVDEFLKKSIRADMRSGLAWRIILFVVLAICTLAAFLMKLSGVELDPVSKEWMDWTNLFSPVMLASYAAYSSLLLCSIINRFRGKPTYQSINATFFVWTLASLILIVSDICLSPYSIFVDIPIFFVWGNKLYNWIQRKTWKKKFTPRRFSDRFWFKLKSISISILATILATATIAIFMGISSDKDDLLKNRADTADKLFRGLDNIRDGLSFADQHYVDTIWCNYLKNNFADDLSDSIWDEHEQDFARCLINLKCPNTALKYLYPDDKWGDHVLFIKALDRMGRFDDAANVIKIYLDQCQEGKLLPFVEIGSYNTSNFIWTAEKAGRFDLAERLFSELSDTIKTKFTNAGPAASFLINHGHVFLSQGDFATAYSYYDKAINLYDSIKVNLAQDMHTFSRFGVMPNNLLEEVCNHYHLNFVPAYTSHKESSQLNNYYKRLDGEWKCELGDGITIDLFIEADDKLLTYHIYQGSDIVSSFNAIVRFEKKSGMVYWDEFCTDNDYNSFGKITKMEKDAFILEIIENGNPGDKGKRRIYRKIE